MALLSLQSVTLNLGGQPLLDNAELHLEAGERVCLVGRNGTGKSSLFRLLSDALRPDSGQIVRTPGVVFGHMAQTVPAAWQGSVFGIVAEGLGATGKALAGAHCIATGREAGLNAAALREAQGFLEAGDGWERYGDVISVINHLGIDPEADFAHLSGGSQRRVALARALVGAEHLLLDEPTNHLDIKTIAWLEDFLLRRVKTLMLISHDRAFVQRLATRVVEIDRGKLYSYACSFDQYFERREARLENEAQQAALFDKKLAQEEAWIRQGVKARRTRNMGRVRALQSMRSERAERRQKMGNVNMQAQEAERSGKLVIEVRNLSFSYPDGYEVVQDFSTLIQRGDRVGLVGDNGTGKTTLLRLLLGELEPSAGMVRHGTRLEISYFDQHRDQLDDTASVMDSIADGNDIVTINGQTRNVAGYLRDFLFESDRFRIPVGRLSGGERNRLLLARLFTRPSNVLVLDEPTNDLDMETLELLEELLDAYTGTVIMVSHDRSFLDNLVTSTLALEGDKLVHEYVGGYTDWVRQRAQAKEQGAGEAKAAGNGSADSSSVKPRRLSYNEQRKKEQLTQAVAAYPARIEALEGEQAQLEQKLTEADLYTRDPQAFNAAVSRLSAVEAEQLRLLEEWEKATQQLDIFATLE